VPYSPKGMIAKGLGIDQDNFVTLVNNRYASMTYLGARAPHPGAFR
jgi:hypothetical protein